MKTRKYAKKSLARCKEWDERPIADRLMVRDVMLKGLKKAVIERKKKRKRDDEAYWKELNNI